MGEHNFMCNLALTASCVQDSYGKRRNQLRPLPLFHMKRSASTIIASCSVGRQSAISAAFPRSLNFWPEV